MLSRRDQSLQECQNRVSIISDKTVPRSNLEYYLDVKTLRDEILAFHSITQHKSLFDVLSWDEIF